MFFKIVFVVCSAGITLLADASPVESLVVPKFIWQKLSLDERQSVSNRYIVETFEQDRYAKIIDIQMVDESTFNDKSMARLGSQYGRAAYIDSVNWRYYSATDNITAGVIGGLIGGLSDKKTEIKFHFRYTLEQSDGDILVKDIYQSNQFSHPVGRCVDVDVSRLVNSMYCRRVDLEDLRNKVLSAYNRKDSTEPPSSYTEESKQEKNSPQQADVSSVVSCKIGTAPVVNISPIKCNKVKGVIIQ